MRRFISENYRRAEEALKQHKDALMTIANELLTREVLDGEQVKKIVQGDALAPMPEPPVAQAVVTDAPAVKESPAPSAGAGLMPPSMPDPIPQQH